MKVLKKLQQDASVLQVARSKAKKLEKDFGLTVFYKSYAYSKIKRSETYQNIKTGVHED